MSYPEDKALPPVFESERKRLLRGLLRGVSRSFYLTLRVLPAELRTPVGLAYLLARAADTIADTRLLPPQRRLELLLRFREQVQGAAHLRALQEIGLALTEMQSLPKERELLASLPVAFAMLEGVAEPDRGLIRSVVVALSQGMEMDLTTFPAEDSGRVAALPDWAALDRYIYHVAGCVGEFWTRITVAHTPQLGGWDVDRMSEVGVRFGKALQLTNVLRDLPRDLRSGRCYLPMDSLAQAGVAPEDLLDPAAWAGARPLLAEGITAALGHFAAAEDYLLAIPRRCLRLRLAALWPALIGLATLARLARSESWLDPACPAKVSRRWVYRMMAASWAGAASDTIVRAWIGRLRRQAEEAI